MESITVLQAFSRVSHSGFAHPKLDLRCPDEATGHMASKVSVSAESWLQSYDWRLILATGFENSQFLED